MRISIIAIGTRGDVQPTLALGKALKRNGHAVRVLASTHFAPWIEHHGLEAAPSRVDIQALMASEGGLDWVETGHYPIRQLRAMKKLVAEHGTAMMEDAWRACADAQAVVSSFTSDPFAASLAEKLGARHVSAPLQPALLATRSGAATPNAPLPNRQSWLNYLFGKLLIEPFGWRLQGELVNRFRRETLGLPAQSYKEYRRAAARSLVVQGVSTQVVPHPSDWPPNIHSTGYWFLDHEPSFEPKPALAEFLAAGAPPVYVGFGSMTGRDPQRITRTIVDAMAPIGRRTVLQAGWAGMGDASLPEDVFLLDAAPHGWLFPRMAAVVHHGGAGTTAEGLRAGRPTVIVPHMADQPFWGARVHAIGAGPRPVPRHKLTAERLRAAVVEATGDPRIEARAKDVAAKIRSESGVAVAACLIESHLTGH
jgi:UDP:flavonoid glycosyltransferase YjiC (YdhE family)